MISIDNVSKHYGSFQVLTECTTQVKKGEVIVVCGPSGSGKSTLIKCVNGLEPFQAGTITVNGVSVGDRDGRLVELLLFAGAVYFAVCFAASQLVRRYQQKLNAHVAH